MQPLLAIIMKCALFSQLGYFQYSVHITSGRGRKREYNFSTNRVLQYLMPKHMYKVFCRK